MLGVQVSRSVQSLVSAPVLLLTRFPTVLKPVRRQRPRLQNYGN
jgi:hypothetical protein